MADLEMDFNAGDVPEDDRNFDPIPAGDYMMQVIESELKDVKSGEGQQLVLTLEVMDGPYSNRRVWDRLNIHHNNADAQRIAQRSLADLCLAVGIQSLRNSEDLHFKPFIGRVSIKPSKDPQYGPSNAVRYKPRGGAPAARPNAAAPQAQTQGQAQKPTNQQQASSRPAGAKPWQRPAA